MVYTIILNWGYFYGIIKRDIWASQKEVWDKLCSEIEADLVEVRISIIA